MLKAKRSRSWLFCLFTVLCMTLFLPVGWTEEGTFIRDGQFSLEVRALPLNSVEAFFLARGFSTTETKVIVESGCVHKFAAAHDGDAKEKAVSVDLTTWQVRSSGNDWNSLALKETWAQSWKERNVSKPAQIAFRWALFPTQQTFHPGDRNWGMVPMGFLPGTTFDLKAVLHVGEKSLQTVLTQLQCASPGVGS